MDEQWDRREGDRKARQELVRQMEKLEAKVDDALDRLGEEVNELNEYLRGGVDNSDPLGTRVHLVETGLAELRVVVKGDSLGRGSLIEMAKQAIADAAEARKIAQGKVEVQTTRRGQNVSVLIQTLTVAGVISVGLLSNWDKVSKFFGKSESPVEYADRIRADIAQLKKQRGKEVEKKLREIEREAREYR